MPIIKCRCGKNTKGFKKDIGPFYIGECCEEAGYDYLGNRATDPNPDKEGTCNKCGDECTCDGKLGLPKGEVLPVEDIPERLKPFLSAEIIKIMEENKLTQVAGVSFLGYRYNDKLVSEETVLKKLAETITYMHEVYTIKGSLAICIKYGLVMSDANWCLLSYLAFDKDTSMEKTNGTVLEIGGMPNLVISEPFKAQEEDKTQTEDLNLTIKVKRGRGRPKKVK